MKTKVKTLASSHSSFQSQFLPARGLDISTPYKSRLATPILQRMKFNLLFARALSVKSYCLHYVFKLLIKIIEPEAGPPFT